MWQAPNMPRVLSLHLLRPRTPQVVHKAVLQLDEKGLEAATCPRVMLEGASEPLTFRFDRPFVLMIFDHFSWSSLFLGKVVNPT